MAEVNSGHSEPEPREVCEDYAGHEWAPAGNGMLICMRCEAEEWEDDRADLECTHCAGEGSCCDGADPLGDCPDEAHRCHACNGSGKRKDQTIF